jgi:hypothetical protein
MYGFFAFLGFVFLIWVFILLLMITVRLGAIVRYLKKKDPQLWKAEPWTPDSPAKW